ncbi:MAG: type VI secretion system baseplate subunit TssF [Acetobacter sp.]
MSEKSDHRRYYEDELAYLRDMGEVFAQANPDVAGLLSRQSHDPDIERLFEAFAFLTSRLRQRMDAGNPDYSHSLVSVFCPEYLRAIPSMTMLECAADPSGEVVVLPAQTEILSQLVSGVQCRFRTCQPLPVVPARISAVSWQERNRSTQLQLTLAVSGKAGLRELAGHSLSLFLDGGRDRRIGRLLLQALLTDATSISVSTTEGFEARLPGTPAHVGFGDDGALLPWSSGTTPALRVMQEYLAFSSPFVAVTLPPLPDVPEFTGNACTLTISFSRRISLPVLPEPADVRLNCVPAINLFEEKGEPVRLLPNRLEYRVRPARAQESNAQVYSVQTARGMSVNSQKIVDFATFGQFDHLRPSHSGHYFQVRVRPSVGGAGLDHWLSFIDGQEQLLLPAVNTVSTTLLCTNGARAAFIPVGGINKVGKAVRYGGAIRNIMPTTPEVQPPLNENMMWRLISVLAGSMQPLEHITALRALIDTLDFAARQDEQARLRQVNRVAALRSISTKAFDGMARGFPVRGLRTSLEVDGAGFSSRGDVYLFGLMLNTFFKLSKPVNTIWQFELCDVNDNSSILFPVCQGRTSVG